MDFPLKAACSCGWLALAAVGFAAPIEADSRIEAVTVYSDRARVARAVSVDLPGGQSTIRFGGLPVALDDSSVQAGGAGARGLTVLNLEIRQKFFEQVVDQRVRDLETQLQALGDTENALRGAVRDAEGRRTFLDNVRQMLTHPAGESGFDLKAVEPLYGFYSTNVGTVTKELLELGISLRDLQPRRKLIEEELARLRGSGSRTEKEVLVTVQNPTASQATLTLDYTMMGASWQPEYAARVDTKEGKISLAMFGLVRQQTGENWRDVRLTLSTARPSVGARMPDLDPWWLEIIEVMPAAEAVAEPLSLAQPRDQKPTNRDLARNEFSQAIFGTATIDSSGVSTVFDVRTPVTIAPDGEPVQVPVSVTELTGKLTHVTTPKLSTEAFLRASLTNTTGAPILGGMVSLFRDGDFVGKSRVNFIAPSAEFDFYLGVDDAVKVTRKTLLDRIGDAGLLSRNKRLQRQYETTVENFRAQPVTLTVIDQIPVSQNAAVIVANIRLNPSPKIDDRPTGRVEWELPLAPREKKSLTTEFTVEWPGDRSVSGL
jgi:uncharacterized protein (TIGR02231 family)